jgi:ABC-type uncharacterized transport system substrate-binding protein
MHLKRREFITLLGGAAVAWPLAAGAQQQERVRRIGVLMYGAESAEAQARLTAFAHALKQLGWSDGRNLRIDIRWATADDARSHAAELVALAPDVLLAATGTATVAPLLQATRAVPIVFVTVIDPVGAGFVASLAQKRADALLVAPQILFSTRRVQLATLAARHAVPTIYSQREYVEYGGLMSYGSSIIDRERQLGIYTGRILKGEKPIELPILRAVKFEFIINLQTAKTIGLDVPPTLIARADEVIE